MPSESRTHSGSAVESCARAPPPPPDFAEEPLDVPPFASGVDPFADDDEDDDDEEPLLAAAVDDESEGEDADAGVVGFGDEPHAAIIPVAKRRAKAEGFMRASLPEAHLDRGSG